MQLTMTELDLEQFRVSKIKKREYCLWCYRQYNINLMLQSTSDSFHPLWRKKYNNKGNNKITEFRIFSTF